MASKRIARFLVAALAASVMASALPTGSAAGTAPTPLATVVPFPLPLLEGPQAKVELGVNAPAGPATSLWGLQPAKVLFSVWWWDTAAPTQAFLYLDGNPYAMSPAAGGDDDDTNGTLYQVEVDGPNIAAGDHAWYFDFSRPGASFRLPAAGSLNPLRLDTADRFISDPLLGIAQQVRNDRLAGTIVQNLRDAVEATATRLDPQMATHWDAVDGYTYADLNHYIIQPVGATAGNLEAYVTATGASRARYTDGPTFINNSQPAIKQAFVLKGVLLATRLFNESDIEIWTETMVVNNTTYHHPFLRVQLNDLSEEPGDGPVDGDNWMDVDLWGLGLVPQVPIGSHFGEDFDGSNDVAWTGSVGWPPVDDTTPEYVLSTYRTVQNLTVADGSVVSFYIFESRVNAILTNPVVGPCYWTDQPMVFDGLSSNQTANVDLFYDWEIPPTVWNAFGPVWLLPIAGVGTYNVTLTVRDAFGQQDSATVSFCLHGKTRLRQAMPDVTLDEDTTRTIDLRSYFHDDDGPDTIRYTIIPSPPGEIFVDRFPANSPSIDIFAGLNQCPTGQVSVEASDGESPPIVQVFNVSVVCKNDNPVFAPGLPSSLNFTEDTQLVVPNMRSFVIDPDAQDQLLWSFTGSRGVTAVYDPGADTLTFSAPPNEHPIDNGVICVTDGTTMICRSLVIQVIPANDPPTMIAPVPLLHVDEDAPEAGIDLSAYFTDPDGDNLVAAVTPGQGVEATWNPVLREVRFRPLADYSGQTTIGLRVFDPSNASVSATVDIDVRGINDPPVVVSFEPTGYVTAREGEILTFALNADDGDSNLIIYSGDLDGQSLGNDPGGAFEWRTDFSSAGRHAFTITASDGAGGTVSHRWDIQVENSNRAPTVTIVSAGLPRYAAGTMVSLSAQGEDPDGDDILYTWTFGGLIQPKTGQDIEVRFSTAGNYTVTVTVNDGQAQGNDTVAIEIYFDLPPPPPPPPTNETPTSPGLELPAIAIAIGGVATLLLFARRRRPE